MGTVIDLSKQKFGLLTVIERDFQTQRQKNSTRAYWKCQCECGNIISCSTQKLKETKIPSCGCYNNQREAHIIDITGLKIGKLTVISRNNEYDINKNKSADRDSYWNCLCECGNICVRSKSSLRVSNSSKSIACCEVCHHLKINNLTNKRKFMLTLMYPTGEKRGSYNVWHCKCDCGNEVEFTTNELSWKTNCGCIQKKSKGEIIIETILKENNIKYIYNKGYFKDLLYPSGVIGRYDFILLDENNNPYRIVEFDGEQHFSKEANSFFCGPDNSTTFDEAQKRDMIKNIYAKQHNIPMVRIPYTMLNKLSLDIILGDKFLI